MMPAVHGLVGIALRTPLREELAYENANVQRQALVALSEFMKENPTETIAVFEEHGVRTLEDFQIRMSHVSPALLTDLELGFALL